MTQPVSRCCEPGEAVGVDAGASTRLSDGGFRSCGLLSGAAALCRASKPGTGPAREPLAVD